jgi:hypothetical protein
MAIGMRNAEQTMPLENWNETCVQEHVMYPCIY